MIFDIQGAWIDCACNVVLDNSSQDQVGALSPFEGTLINCSKRWL